MFALARNRKCRPAVALFEPLARAKAARKSRRATSASKRSSSANVTRSTPLCVALA